MIPNPYRGKFVVMEGIDGCGKSEQVKRLVCLLRETPAVSDGWNIPFPVVETKEPNRNGFWGWLIYKDLADPNGLHARDPKGFQTWYACDSQINLSKRIIPSLSAGAIVISDRFRPSLVYGARDRDEIGELMLMNQFIIGKDFIWPDLIFIFDLPVVVAMERLRKKGAKLDDHEKAEFLEGVRRNYLTFARFYPSCIVIDASRSEEVIFEEIKEIVSGLINLGKFGCV